VASDESVDRTAIPVQPSSPSPAPSDSEQEKGNGGPKPGSISGTVRLKATGAPVAGASVQARTGNRSFDSALVHTDEKGSYTLTGVFPYREYYISARSQSPEFYIAKGDGASLRTKPGEIITGKNVWLSQGQLGVVAGTVVGRTITCLAVDNPTSSTSWKDYETVQDVVLPGVKVCLDPQGEDQQETVTDEAGRFRFEKVRPGIYCVRAESPEGAAFATEEERSRGANLTEKSVQEDLLFYFRMDGISIEGRVIDPKGNPIAGAEITASKVSQNLNNGTLDFHSIGCVLSNAQGQFRLDNLPVLYDLSSGFQYLRDGKCDSEFQLQGKAQGFCVGQTAVSPFPPNLFTTAFKMDENHLKTTPPEKVASLLYNLQYADIKLPKGEGHVITGVDLILSPAGIISGRVVDKRGNNLLSGDEEKTSSTRIYLIPTEKEPPRQIPSPSIRPLKIPDEVTLGKGSRFRIENVPAGNYYFGVTLYHNGLPINARAKNEVLAFREGETIQDLDVVVESATELGNITGHVVDALTGEPVEALSVEVLKLEGSDEPKPRLGNVRVRELEGEEGWVVVNDDLPVGDFSITGLSAGKATPKISAQGYLPIQVEVEIPAGETVEQIFQLGGEGGGLLGLVVDAETQEPIERFDVQIVDGNGEPVKTKVRMNPETKGAFTLSGLPAGSVDVEISEVLDPAEPSERNPNSSQGEAPDSQKQPHSPLREKVEISLGEMTQKTFQMGRKGSLSGRVEMNGKGVESATVWVQVPGNKNIQKFSATSDEEGHYRCEGLDSGEYPVLAIIPGNEGGRNVPRVTLYDRLRVTIKAGEETQQDFSLGKSASLQPLFKMSDRNLNVSLIILEGAVSTLDSSNPMVNDKIRASVSYIEANDRFEIRGLSSGTYTLIARYGARQSGESSKSEKASEKIQVVTLTEGQALTVDFEFP
jgi:protocatechuate 3,4-dioxygenase beta subunit